MIMSAYWWSGYPYDQVCKSSDGGYVACNQNFFASLTFPPLPRFQPEGMEWMVESQVILTSLYSYTSVLVVLFAILQFLRHCAIPWTRSLHESTYEPDGMAFTKTFTKVAQRREVHGYIPQTRMKDFLFPLLTCDIEGINKDLVGWSDWESGHEPHSLVRDVEAIVRKKQLPHVFSVVQQWTK